MALTQIKSAQIDSITASQISDVTASATELNYVDGVTSSIQTQLNAKAPTADPTFTGTLTYATLNDGTTDLTSTVAELNILSGVTADATELNYVDGVTSAIQTQLNSKLNLSGGTMSGAIAMGTSKITGLGDPSSAQDAATKNYVDSVAAGLSWKESVRAATTEDMGNITISTALNNGDTFDSLTLATGDRILVKNQTDKSENGIYIVDATPVRASDMNEADEFSGTAVFVQEGTHADQGFVCTNDGDVTVDTTNITFTQFTGTGAFDFRSGLVSSGNSIDVAFRSEVFLGSDFGDTNINTDFAISYLEADPNNRNDFNGMEAPAAGADTDAGRNNYPFNVYLNGILLSNIKLATSASEAAIEDFLAGTNTASPSVNGDSLQFDCVALISDSRNGFKLYFNQADIADGDIVTLVYAL